MLGPEEPPDDPEEYVSFGDDGWVQVVTATRRCHRMFWVPPHWRGKIDFLRGGFSGRLQLGRGLDMSRFVFGRHWNQCYDASVSPHYSVFYSLDVVAQAELT